MAELFRLVNYDNLPRLNLMMNPVNETAPRNSIFDDLDVPVGYSDSQMI